VKKWDHFDVSRRILVSHSARPCSGNIAAKIEQQIK
jgi:hypothetical protein